MVPSTRLAIFDWAEEHVFSRARSIGRSLSLLIAAAICTTILAVASGALHHAWELYFQGLPYSDPQRLVAVTGIRGPTWRAAVGTSSRLFLPWFKEDQMFERLAAFRWETFAVSAEGRAPEFVPGARVTGEFFPALGVKAQYGRTILPDDEISGRVVVVSSSFWQRHLGARPGAIGGKLTINGETFTIGGVMPPRFWFISQDVQFWVPLELEAPGPSQRPMLCGVIGRLRPLIALDQARWELRDIAARHKLYSKPRLSWLEDEILRDMTPAVAILGISLAAVSLIALLRFVQALADRRERAHLADAARGMGCLVAKALLGSLALGGLWVALLDPARQPMYGRGNGESMAFLVWLFGLACWGLVWWCLLDQRYRCRVCLRRLRMPVDTGSWSTPLLNRPGTEYICPFGHGKMNVSSVRLFGAESERWTYFGNFWDELELQSTPGNQS